MAAYTLNEFAEVDADGDPIFPPLKTTAGVAFGTATLVDASTRYLILSVDVDARVRFSSDGSAAVASGIKLLATDNYGIVVDRARRPMYVNAVAG